MENIKSIDYFKNDEKQATSLLGLDTLLNGGLKSGIIQLVGESKVGKTFISLQIAYVYCRLDKKVLFIDVKGDVSIEILERMGLRSFLDSNFHYVRHGTFDEIEKTLDEKIKNSSLDLIIIDSLPAILNKGYLNLESDGRKKGIKTDNYNTNFETRPLMLLVNKLKQLALNKNICFLFINEYRNKIDKRIGTIRKIYGPKALHYQSNTIIQINEKCYDLNLQRKFEPLKDENIGVLLEFELFKGNTLRPNLKVPFFLRYGLGYCRIGELIIMLINTEKLISEGGCYKINELGISKKGMLELYNYLLSDYPKIFSIYQQQLLQYYNSLKKC